MSLQLGQQWVGEFDWALNGTGKLEEDVHWVVDDVRARFAIGALWKREKNEQSTHYRKPKIPLTRLKEVGIEGQ